MPRTSIHGGNVYETYVAPASVTGTHGVPVTRGDENRYRASRDAARGMSRVVRHEEPAKPGIPVERNPNGGWRIHRDVGPGAGGAMDADKARAQAFVDAKKRDLETKTAERDTKRAELENARRVKSHVARDVSRLEDEIASLESERLSHERQLAELERR
ncbi:hypothetical protein [Paraburkholderia sp. 2C]|jgi:hypothetical protein